LLEGRGEQGRQLAPPADDVPLRFDRLGGHPPRRQVRGIEEEGVREQQVEVERVPAVCAAPGGGGPGVLRTDPREQGIDCREVVVLGAQALAIRSSQRSQEHVGLRCQSAAVAPGGPLRAHPVEEQQIRQAEQPVSGGGTGDEARLQPGGRRTGRRGTGGVRAGRCDGKAGRQSNEQEPRIHGPRW